MSPVRRKLQRKINYIEYSYSPSKRHQNFGEILENTGGEYKSLLGQTVYVANTGPFMRS